MQIQVGIISISDRASHGLYDDQGGPALREAADGHNWKTLASVIVPDQKKDIQKAIHKLIAKGCRLILTTGGTGVAPRDATPEAVREISLCELPGFGEIMRVESMKITPNAILSRSLAVVVEKKLGDLLAGETQRCSRVSFCSRKGDSTLHRGVAGGRDELLRESNLSSSPPTICGYRAAL